MAATDVDGLTNGTVFTLASAATNGSAFIDPTSGAWTFTPTDTDWYGSDSFMITVTDDLGGTTTQVVNITLANIDDAAVITGDISYTGNEGDIISGNMAATDVEGLTDGTIFSINSADTHGTAFIDPASGVWTVSPTDADWFGMYGFTVTVTDDLGGTTTQLINITLANVADIPIISGIDSGAVTEDVGVEGNALVMIGDLVIVDQDIGESTFQPASVTGIVGTFIIDSTGSWTYTAENNQIEIQQLDSGQTLTESFTVFAFDGTTHTVIIDIIGTEDAPVLTGVATGEVSKDRTLTVSNTLFISDVDVNDNPINFTNETNSYGDNGYGLFSIVDGVWTYTLDNDHPAVQALDHNEKLNDSYTLLKLQKTSTTRTALTILINWSTSG